MSDEPIFLGKVYLRDDAEKRGHPNLILAFAVGGIGLITFSMMARVSLGHTGRNVHEPPKLLVMPLLLLSAAGLLRAIHRTTIDRLISQGDIHRRGKTRAAKYYPGYARNEINLLELIKERQGLENSRHPLL